MHSGAISALAVALWATVANAHLAAFAKGMYCLNGSSGSVNLNSEDPIFPLYMLEFDDWWFHHVNKCDEFPPDEGDFLELPAGGSFTVEIAANQAYTTLSWNGKFAGDGVIGKQEYADDLNIPDCITYPNIHTQNQSMTAGTAFTIAYTSELSEAKPENMVVFSVRHHTPWKRVTTYDVPANMPACPEGGCICAWNWIPNACGQSNIYHQGFRCKVTGATSTTPVGTPQPPVWCENDQSNCVQGPKQGLYWNQLSGTNINVLGQEDLEGEWRSPGYNAKCGFADGAQNDIFQNYDGSSSSSSSTSSSSAQVDVATSSYVAPVASSSDAPAPADSTSYAAPAPTSDDTSSSVTSYSDPAPTTSYSDPAPTTSYSDPAPTVTSSDVPTTWDVPTSDITSGLVPTLFSSDVASSTSSDVASSASSADASIATSGTRKCKRRANAKRNVTVPREHRRNARHWSQRSSL